jgi:oligoribonuclease (3'-5' exoribonuclease)
MPPRLNGARSPSLKLHAKHGASTDVWQQHLSGQTFLAREMPALEKFFHYRNLDVST